jgi:hypothetical protein
MSNAANIPTASMRCLASGCIASTGPDPHPRCLQGVCQARDFTARNPAAVASPSPVPAGETQQMYVPARKPDGHTQLCDDDSCVCGLMGTGFPGFTGDLAAKSPTVPPESHGERAQDETAADMARDFASWYYWQGDCTGDEYRRLADRIEDRMEKVLGAQELGRLGKE